MALEDLSLHDSNYNEEENLPVNPLVFTKTATNLADLNLEDELLNTYNNTNIMLANLDFRNTPANQQAQVMNTLKAVLSDIIKLRTELYNAERIKKLEAAVIYTLKKFPAMQDMFMEEYEKNARK